MTPASAGSGCPGCGVRPGEVHVEGCDVARCGACGSQRLGCEHEGDGSTNTQTWTGRWPGTDEVAEGLGTDLNDLVRKAASGGLSWDGQRWRATHGTVEPIWNTRVTVIDLVPARNAEEAIRRLTERCEQRGLDVHVDGDDTQAAFASELLPPDMDTRARMDWTPTAVPDVPSTP